MVMDWLRKILGLKNEDDEQPDDGKLYKEVKVCSGRGYCSIYNNVDRKSLKSLIKDVRGRNDRLRFHDYPQRWFIIIDGGDVIEG